MAVVVVYTVLAYLAAGVLVGVEFALRGVNAVDPGARGASWGFRVLIVPGAAALWPWVLGKRLRASRTATGERHG